ncbi:hypothetical protein ABIB85_008068 [Bradyrhizobium sp. JR1.5]|uniref:hypothetical protein n=1 Tax=unclassified Bradyrhizobium TaxID=2631580 RepID=UPI003394A2B9
MKPLPQVLAFAVFGTVVDWHTSLVRELDAMDLGVSGDEFTLAWRAGHAACDVRRAWLDAARRPASHVLDELLVRFRIGKLNEIQKRQLNRVGHRLDPFRRALPVVAISFGFRGGGIRSVN